MTMPFEVPSRKSIATPANMPAPAPARRILFVDDEVCVLESNARVLTSSGYSVDIAEDGAKAWKALHDIHYDLLITDNQMPNMTGLELITRMRSEGITLPVILASGTMPTVELERQPWLHVDALLPKPFAIEELLNMVGKILNAAAGVTDEAKLFRDCAMLDERGLQTNNPASMPSREQLNLSCRILVVDDDNDTRQQSVAVLAGSGYDVESAKDGAAGWDALQTNDYDLVVTDNKMPNMTGIEMVARLRSAAMTVPVIMATGVLPYNIIAHDTRLKPDAMLQRPFSGEDLLAAVRNVLRTHDESTGSNGTPLP
jgi:two-component system sensor histidine kinase/response regulator